LLAVDAARPQGDIAVHPLRAKDRRGRLGGPLIPAIFLTPLATYFFNRQWVFG
jgi:hypothetical protein